MVTIKAELVDSEKFYTYIYLPGNDIKAKECEHNGVKVLVDSEGGIYPHNLLLIDAGDNVLAIKVISITIKPNIPSNKSVLNIICCKEAIDEFADIYYDIASKLGFHLRFENIDKYIIDHYDIDKDLIEG